MPRKYYICCIAFFIASPHFSQESKFKKFRQLNRPEKFWVFFHPFIATKAARLTQKAIQVTDEIKKDPALDGDESGGQVDAFRHSYWMTLLAQKIKPKKALKLGVAHEKGNKIQFKKSKLEEGILPDSVSSVMDMENNKTGIEIGKNNRQLNESELQLLIKKNILEGNMKIILKNENGFFLDCQNNAIDLSRYKAQWNIPKCLVNSDRTFRKKTP